MPLIQKDKEKRLKNTEIYDLYFMNVIASSYPGRYERYEVK